MKALTKKPPNLLNLSPSYGYHGSKNGIDARQRWAECQQELNKVLTKHGFVYIESSEDDPAFLWTKDRISGDAVLVYFK